MPGVFCAFASLPVSEWLYPLSLSLSLSPTWILILLAPLQGRVRNRCDSPNNLFVQWCKLSLQMYPNNFKVFLNFDITSMIHSFAAIATPLPSSHQTLFYTNSLSTNTNALLHWASRKARASSSLQSSRIVIDGILLFVSAEWIKHGRRRRTGMQRGAAICTYVGTEIQNWRGDTNKTHLEQRTEPNRTNLDWCVHKETEITFTTTPRVYFGDTPALDVTMTKL